METTEQTRLNNLVTIEAAWMVSELQPVLDRLVSANMDAGMTFDAAFAAGCRRMGLNLRNDAEQDGQTKVLVLTAAADLFDAMAEQVGNV